MQKKYHISTIVNLLLDMDFAIENDFLETHELEKGIQTMVDEETHHQLLDRLQNLHPKRAAGGACTNSVFAAACLGARTFVNGRIGNDEEANALVSSLTSANIQMNEDIKLRTQGNTGKCIVLVTPDAERTMLTYLGVSSEIPLSSINVDSILNSEYFLVEGFQCIPDQSRQTNLKAIQMAHSAGAKIAVSLCDEAVVDYFYDQIMQFMQAAPIEILFCNQFEALSLTKSDTLEQACESLKKMARQFVLTKGADGALIWDSENLIKIQGQKATAKDTTGAGDIFTGVFLWALTHAFDHQQAGILANKAAAELVTHYGPRLTLEELETVFQSFQKEVFRLKENADVVG